MFKTSKQIANEYGICVRTLNKNLLKNGIRLKRGNICPTDQELIYRTLGRWKRFSEACGGGYYLSICSRTIGGPLLCSDCDSVISECPGN